jgi:membrane protein
VLALYSASSGVQTLFTALNIAYEEEETRGFVRFYLTSFAFTLAAVVGCAPGPGPARRRAGPAGPPAAGARYAVVVRLGSLALLLALVAAGVAAIYRFGPSRAPASWRWLTPGSIAATVLWLLASLGFSWYVTNFAGYNETYGTLGGVIVLLMWLWISAYVVLLGAELNAELELQTAHDTTTGPPLPKGQRGAYAADHTPTTAAARPRTPRGPEPRPGPTSIRRLFLPEPGPQTAPASRPSGRRTARARRPRPSAGTARTSTGAGLPAATHSSRTARSASAIASSSSACVASTTATPPAVPQA